MQTNWYRITKVNKCSLVDLQMKTVQCHVHYTFLKSETSARYSSDSGNGSNISVDLWGFLTQARHINRMIYMMTTMISKIVPTQAAFCRTKIYVTTVISSPIINVIFLPWPCRSDCRNDVGQYLGQSEVWTHILGNWVGHKSTCKLLPFPINITK